MGWEVCGRDALPHALSSLEPPTTSVVPRVLVPVAVVAALSMSLVSSADASVRPPRLQWKSCGDAGVLCATLSAPRDYDQPRGERLRIAVAKSPATDPRHRIGALVFNLGGPGDPAVDLLASIGSAATRN
jgi:hypothetical protein